MDVLRYISLNKDIEKFFETIPDTELSKHCKIKTYKPHDIIAKKGENINFASVIVSGRALLLNEFENGHAYILKELHSLSVIGDIEIISSNRAAACTIETVENCTLIIIKDNIFLEWINLYHKFSINVSKRLAERFYDSSFENGKYLVYNSNYGLVSTIINIVENSSGFNPKKTFNIKMKNTRKELGDRIGLNERTINRLLLKLKNENLITISSGKIYINNNQHTMLIELKENLQMDRRKKI